MIPAQEETCPLVRPCSRADQGPNRQSRRHRSLRTVVAVVTVVTVVVVEVWWKEGILQCIRLVRNRCLLLPPVCSQMAFCEREQGAGGELRVLMEEGLKVPEGGVSSVNATCLHYARSWAHCLYTTLDLYTSQHLHHYRHW